MFFKVHMWFSKMFYQLPFRMRPIYPKKPMWCSLWYAWDTLVWFGLNFYFLFFIFFYFLRFQYLCCEVNESGQITWEDVKLWTLFVSSMCVLLGRGWGISITQPWPKSLLHNKDINAPKAPPLTCFLICSLVGGREREVMDWCCELVLSKWNGQF